MSRKRPSLSLAKKVKKFYGDACVICGKKGAQLAHISEINDETVFENLVPLCPNSNDEMRLHKDFSHLNDIDPSALLLIADKTYRSGYFSRSYACDRLASHIFETRGNNHSQAVNSAIYCLSSLRFLRQTALIRHCVELIIRLCKKQQSLSPFWKGEFLSKLGLVLFSYGRPILALPILEMSDREFKKVSSIDFNWDEIELRKSRALKHSSWIAGIFSGSEKERDECLGQLKQSIEVATKYRNPQARGSALLAEAFVYVSADKVEKSRESAEEALSIDDHNDIATSAHLHALYGVLLSKSSHKDLKAAERELKKAASLYAKYGLHPDPIRLGGDFRAIEPVHELQRMGLLAPFSDSHIKFFLDSWNIEVRGNPKPECPFTLSDLKSIIGTVSAL